MIRTQIQLPDPLFRQLKAIAESHDWSLAELIRRGMEVYAATFPPDHPGKEKWKMPVLGRGGGLLVDPATVSPEADAIELRAKGE